MSAHLHVRLPVLASHTSGTEVRLSSAHASVNSDNVEEYIQRALLYRLHEFDAAVEAVRTGMSQVRHALRARVCVCVCVYVCLCVCVCMCIVTMFLSTVIFSY